MRKPKIPMWVPLSGIPGVSDKDGAAENTRITQAETGNKPKRANPSSVQVINDYQTVYKQLHGGVQAIVVHSGGGWYRVNETLSVRLDDIIKMTNNLRKRL